MRNLLQHLWKDEAGFVVSAELILISTVLVLAIVVGLAEVAYGINVDLQETTTTFGTIPSSYRYADMTPSTGNSSGNGFQNQTDFSDAGGNIGGQPMPQGWGSF